MGEAVDVGIGILYRVLSGTRHISLITGRTQTPTLSTSTKWLEGTVHDRPYLYYEAADVTRLASQNCYSRH